MATERKGGLGAMGSSLLRSTEPTRTATPPTPPEPPAAAPPVGPEVATPARDPEPAEDLGQADDGAGQGGAGGGRRKRLPRTRRLDAGGPQVGCKFYLPQQLHGRLWQYSLERGKTISELAAEILDRHVPRYKVERQG